MDIAGFSVPMWMIEKMRHQMLAMRTDLPKLPKHRSRSVTPNIAQEVINILALAARLCNTVKSV